MNTPKKQKPTDGLVETGKAFKHVIPIIFVLVQALARSVAAGETGEFEHRDPATVIRLNGGSSGVIANSAHEFTAV